MKTLSIVAALALCGAALTAVPERAQATDTSHVVRMHGEGDLFADVNDLAGGGIQPAFILLTTSGGGLLQGVTLFAQLAPQPHGSGSPDLVTLTGNASGSTRDGLLSFVVDGVLDLTTGRLTATFDVTAGSGLFEGAAGTLELDADADLATSDGFETSLEFDAFDGTIVLSR